MTDRPLALLRCDAVPAGGVGHLVRCLAVAEAAVAAGWRPALVGDFRAPLAEELVARSGLEVLGGAEAPLDRLAGRTGARVVHVDHYATTAPAPGDPGSGAPVVSAVQDGRHGRRPAHVVLDASSTGDVSAAVVQPARVRLTGPGQALVRAAVSAAAGRRRADGAAQDRVLVTAGGTDAAGIVAALTEIVAGAVAAAGLPAEVLVLDPAAGTGPSPAGPPGVRRRPPGPDLVELAADSCLVVTAGGTTTSELAVIGVPMAVVQAVGNQEETYRRLVGAGAALGLGQAADLRRDHDRLVGELAEVLRDRDRREGLAAAAAGQIDGRGAERLVRAWERVASGAVQPAEQGWSVVAAGPADSDLLLAWRNDAETRAQSLDRRPVAADAHARWLAGVLGDPDRLLLVVRRGGSAMGTVRFDRLADDRWEASITVAPEARGAGVGRTVLGCGEEFLAARLPAAVHLTARVRAGNAASRRLFAGCGYRPAPAAPSDVLALGKRLEP
ncbi:bifunctional UDP-2,4-diacetamido-2,4,6-trideoxy-beta-L-altropyranose hydrolase/GNAT family N-acetyltransferase [Blastococcus xanthinilyticus]|uniref:Spore coat polysaccharide biosynthesis predicted glycosyltransferase SpsG n=1 Tax=Blastococcus xanthinilyticus TaxID=1564164 RepID=A0A5S5D1G7_9ACTN|nr:bifunctional UDP-2,4-diacetamido-2,4,6-trideoxy-beta-L-altropyranose hydrolase/GNAT family N-acetyltransferase [Blastococcus xanthinilyticus]TYP89851.1 spore coat polysaccharide biosynthesis predicted glycosyltransferase SpsG [Blastococcus xanthinilyticus]